MEKGWKNAAAPSTPKGSAHGNTSIIETRKCYNNVGQNNNLGKAARRDGEKEYSEEERERGRRSKPLLVGYNKGTGIHGGAVSRRRKRRAMLGSMGK